MATCHRCGTEVPPEARFCDECGADLTASARPAEPPPEFPRPDTAAEQKAGATADARPTAPAAPRFCRSCGKPLSPEAKFCRHCGTSPGAAPQPPSRPEPEPVPPQPAQPTPSAAATSCRNCGKPLSPEAKFCRHCGASPGLTPPPKRKPAPPRPPTPPRPRVRPRRYGPVIAAACAVAVIAAGLGAWQWWLTRPIPVPNLVGISQANAESALGASLKLRVAGQEFSSLAENLVTRQQPEAGAAIRRGRVVQVWLSVGPAVRVPNVVGKSEEEARTELRSVKLGYEVNERAADASVPQGNVVRQDPAAGTRCPAGTVVKVVLSTGPSMGTVPDIRGRSAEEARQLLHSAGFEYQVGAVRLDESATADRVTWQNPAPGSERPSGTVVRVVLSRRGVRAPDVIGQTERQAIATLGNAGLRTRSVSQPSSAPQGQVVQTSPRPGQLVAPGSRVTLVVSQGPPTDDHGYLHVEAEPSSYVIWLYVDGGPTRGKCPMTVRLSPGEHSVQLWDPIHNLKTEFRVTIEAGQTLSVHKRVY